MAITNRARSSSTLPYSVTANHEDAHICLIHSTPTPTQQHTRQLQEVHACASSRQTRGVLDTTDAELGMNVRETQQRGSTAGGRET